MQRLITRATPMGLLVSGLAIGVAASPVLYKGLRCLAVQVIKAGLAVNDQIKSVNARMNESVQDIVAEARTELDNKTEEGRNVFQHLIPPRRYAGIN